MRKSHSEHFSTAVPQKADVVLNAANGSFVPIAVLAGIQNTADASSHLGRFICRKATEQTMLFMIIEVQRQRHAADLQARP